MEPDNIMHPGYIKKVKSGSEAGEFVLKGEEF